MTDRLKGCVVVFTDDIREDNTEAMLNAIRMIKGVLAVHPAGTDINDVFAEDRVRYELWQKVHSVFYPKASK